MRLLYYTCIMHYSVFGYARRVRISNRVKLFKPGLSNFPRNALCKWMGQAFWPLNAIVESSAVSFPRLHDRESARVAAAHVERMLDCHRRRYFVLGEVGNDRDRSRV